MNLFLTLISTRTFDSVLSLRASCLYSSIVVLITDSGVSKFTVNYKFSIYNFFDFEKENPSGKIVLSIIRANKIPTKLYLHSSYFNSQWLEWSILANFFTMILAERFSFRCSVSAFLYKKTGMIYQINPPNGSMGRHES